MRTLLLSVFVAYTTQKRRCTLSKTGLQTALNNHIHKHRLPNDNFLQLVQNLNRFISDYDIEVFFKETDICSRRTV